MGVEVDLELEENEVTPRAHFRVVYRAILAGLRIQKPAAWWEVPIAVQAPKFVVKPHVHDAPWSPVHKTSYRTGNSWLLAVKVTVTSFK